MGKELEENDRTSTMCGSVEYMAPEIAKGPDYSGYKSDSWSLGVLIYVMLTGWNPFDPDNHKEDEDTSCKNILGQVCIVHLLTTYRFRVLNAPLWLLVRLNHFKNI